MQLLHQQQKRGTRKKILEQNMLLPWPNGCYWLCSMWPCGRNSPQPPPSSSLLGGSVEKFSTTTHDCEIFAPRVRCQCLHMCFPLNRSTRTSGENKIVLKRLSWAHYAGDILRRNQEKKNCVLLIYGRDPARHHRKCSHLSEGKNASGLNLAERKESPSFMNFHCRFRGEAKIR